MAYGLSSVDGFDGGVLPLRDYTAVAGLALPEGQVTTDGRLREFLAAVPEPRLLDLFAARYVITDKTGDAWRDGVLFDRQFPITLGPGETVQFGEVDFEATELRLLGDAPPQVEVAAGGVAYELAPEKLSEPDVYSVPWPAGARATIDLRCPETSAACSVDALTLVDGRDGAFWPLVPAPFRLIQSGDVKLYEKTDALPRAYLVSDWTWVADTDAAVAAMATATFDPRRQAVVVGEGPAAAGGAAGVATTATDEPERVIINTSSAGPSLLVLADTDYPGWEARIDGQPAVIHRTNGLFRGVLVPAGDHTVEFAFRPASLRLGAALSAAGILIWLAVALVVYRGGRNRS